MSAGAGAGRILALDGWRGLAILAVLVGHFFPIPGMNLGTIGVELFFVLSGRLMADILFVKKIPLGEFFYRRATRIIPALAVFLVVIWIATNLAGSSYAFSPVWIATSLTFTQNYAAILAHPTAVLDHLWSLCVEEHSYMLLGLIAWLFGRSHGKPMLAVWIVALMAMANGAVSMLVFGQEYLETYTRSDVHVASIFFSGGLYVFVRSHIDNAVLARFATPVFVVALVAGLALSSDSMPMPVMYTAGTACLALAVSLADIAARPIVRVLSFPALTQVGVWSYSIYLWQQPFYKMHDMPVFPGSNIVLLIVGVACGIASYYLIERPARRWLNAQWGRWRKPAADADRASRTPGEPAGKPAS